MRFKGSKVISFIGFLIAAGLSGAGNIALAQTAAEKKPGKSASQLEEVIVTAQRREESAQEVATSITVFTQEQISNANISNTADLATITPSMSVNTMFGPDNAAFNIRGFSKDLRTTATVGVYFAEVVAPRGQILQTSGDGAGPGTLFDLQNIQVLKGPQGTLFGRNTTGGSVLLVPYRPTEEFEGYAEVSAGNYGMRGGQLVVNTPLTNQLKIRFAVDQMDREGYLTNLTGVGGEDFAGINYLAARASIVFDISESIENYTVLNYSDSHSSGHTTKLFVCNPNATEAPLKTLRPQACERQLQRQQEAGAGFYDVISTAPNAGTKIEDKRLINHLTWDIKDSLTVKNILAYSHLETINNQDLFGTEFTETQAALVNLGFPAGVADPNREFLLGYSIAHPDFPVTSQESWVAEIQLQGASFNERLQWQTGIYYENSRPDGPSGNIAPSTLSCDLETIATGDPDQFNCFDALAGQLGAVTLQAFETEYLNKAVYGQATFDVLESLSLTVGARYTSDKTEGEALKIRYKFSADQLTDTSVANQSAVQESEAPTGVVELQYRPVDSVMTYAKYVRGYRQGGINMATDPGVDVYDKETVDNYEIGAKTEFSWPVPSRFNISLFYNDLTDMQLQSGFLSPTSGATTSIFNAGSAEIRGVELDGYSRLTEHLTVSFSYSYIESELIEQDMEGNAQKVEAASGPIAASTFTPIAVVGDELPFTPEQSYTVSLDYRLPLAQEYGDISIGGTYAYTGKQRATSSTFSPYSVIDDFDVINLHLDWRHIFGLGLDLSVFATNVTDEEYITYISGTYNALGLDTYATGQPRMYGARLKYSFGPATN